MLSLPPSVRLFVATQPVDGRKGPDSLMALVRDVLRHDPLSGKMPPACLFVVVHAKPRAAEMAVRPVASTRGRICIEGLCMLTQRQQTVVGPVPETLPVGNDGAVSEHAPGVVMT